MLALSGRSKGCTEVTVPCRGIVHFYEGSIVLCALARPEFQISVTLALTVDLTIRLRMEIIFYLPLYYPLESLLWPISED